MKPRKPLTKIVAANVRRLRVRMKLSRDELAERCLVHPRTLQRAELGFDIRIMTLEQIAHGIGVSINYLLEDQDND